LWLHPVGTFTKWLVQTQEPNLTNSDVSAGHHEGLMFVNLSVTLFILLMP